MTTIFQNILYLLGAFFTFLGLASVISPKAQYYFNLILYSAILAVCSVIGVTYSLLLSLVGQRLNINYLTARTFYYICSPFIGIKFEVEGEQYLRDVLLVNEKGDNAVKGGRVGKGKAEGDRQLPRSAVLVGNHQSFMDILYLGRIFPHRAAIMAKKELKWMPLLGWYMALSGAVFVNRTNREDAVKAMNIAGEEMKAKDVSLWIFPEGTRTMAAKPHLRPFKKGAFHLAVQAQVPIIPVVCENYHHLFDGKTRFKSGVLKIKVLPPVSTEGLTSADVHELTDRVRRQMLDALTEISQSRLTASTDPARIEILTSPEVTASGSVRSENNKRTELSGESSKNNVVAPISPSESSSSSSSNALTGDELDEDGAVLVKRPKASTTAA